LYLSATLQRKGCTNSGYLVAWATKFRTMALNIFSPMIAVSFLRFKKVYQYTCTKHKETDDSKVQGSLHNCVPSAWNLSHVNCMAPVRWFLDFWKICGYLY